MKSFIDRINNRLFHSVDGCWYWTGATDANGYGKICLGKTFISAHRASYIAHIGEIPEGIHVCHSCDNHLCVNPNHLFLGTRSDNMQDMLRKGRGNKARGTYNGNRKLTSDQVLKIRELKKTHSYKQIGEMFGINHNHAYDIVKMNSWKHLSGGT